MRSALAGFLLIAGFALPLSAWAVDTDGDGVDDSVDAFPAYPEATTDTDGDGKPNWIDNTKSPIVFSDYFNGTVFQAGWITAYSVSVSGGYANLSGGLFERVFDVPGGAQLSFRHRKVNAGGNGYLSIDGVKYIDLFTSSSWLNASVQIPAGVHTVSWNSRCSGSLMGCILNPHTQIDDVMLKASNLILDDDDDNDGVLDSADKFPLNATESVDTDNDGIGNTADTDDDNDGALDGADNCPLNVNADQLNTDGDAQGNVCDTDDDNDGVLDVTDQCPLDATASVGNIDADTLCDVNDSDDDNDAVLDGNDNCPLHFNADQMDEDNDGVGNPCDNDGPGKLDTAFIYGMGANYYVASVVPQADGKALIGGGFTTVNGVTRNRIARLNSDGSLDTSFNPGTGANNNVNSVALQADGKVLIGGGFNTVDGVTRSHIARLNSDGSLDTSFNPGTGASLDVYSVVPQVNGKVLIGGDFSAVNGVSRKCIARLNSDGSLDTSFNPGTGASRVVKSVALQTDGKVLIGGAFTTVNGVSRNYIARLNADGSLDTSFNPGTGADSFVNSVALQADGNVLIGGHFGIVNGVPRSRIARLNSNGSLDTSFNPGTGATGASTAVYSVALQEADGKVVIGGVFTAVNGASRNYIARFNSDGSLDAGFNPGIGASSDVYSVALQADGKALIGGNFTNFNGTNINRIARIHTGDADQDGIEDAADYFSNNAAAAFDTDRDGLPDAWLQPNGFGCVANANSCNGLTLDNDNDNDGAPDYLDPEPLNPANSSVWPLNNNYQGSAMRESQAVQ